MVPKCKLCGERHWLSEGHKFASNTASNKLGASNRVHLTASNMLSMGEGAPVPRGEVAGDRNRAEAQVSEALPKQRWNRTAYNAYQREYMRRKRGS